MGDLRAQGGAGRRSGRQARGSGEASGGNSRGSKRSASARSADPGKHGGSSAHSKMRSPGLVTSKREQCTYTGHVQVELDAEAKELLELGSWRVGTSTGPAAAARAFSIADLYTQVGRRSLASVYAARHAFCSTACIYRIPSLMQS